jgi:hypothetical protein
LVQEGTGPSLSEPAIVAGVRWLADHQAPDGHWSLDRFQAKCNCTGTGKKNDVAGTAFGVLPFLAAGRTHKSTDHNPHAKNVERALKYLLLKQQSDGDFGGGMSAHGLASVAVCEAYGLTSDPALKGPAQRALDFIAKAQQADGAWREDAEQKSDTLVLVWQVMALKSGQMAGLNVPTATMANVKKFLDSVGTADGSTYGRTGRPHDRPRGNPPEAASEAGLLCRMYLGWGPRNPGMVKGVAQLAKAPPAARTKDVQYYYLATQVMHHMGGQAWKDWNAKMGDLLIATQDKGADAGHQHQKGSWSPSEEAEGTTGGRVRTTSLALLTLEVYYRQLPLYRRDGSVGKGDGEKRRKVKEASEGVLMGDFRTPVMAPIRADERPALERDEHMRIANRGIRDTFGDITLGPVTTSKYDANGDVEGTKPNRLDHAAQPWKRNRQRPTFARVYVGNGNSLELVSLQATVTVEGPRARTVVDHIFRNPHDRQLEGTFEYPLPTGASPSYFAMFLGQTRNTVPPRFTRRGKTPLLPREAVAQLTPAAMAKHVNTDDWGTLREARVVSRENALEVYEDVVRVRVDPALLEYAGGNTFSGRVFPIPAKGYNRVIIAYEELLPCSQDKVVYHYPLPGRKLSDLQFTLQASAAECKEPAFHPRAGTKAENDGRLTYTRAWTNEKPEGEVRFSFTPPRPQVQAISGRQGETGPQYLYARIRPELKKVENEKPFAGHAVFLLDTSLSEYPDRFALNMKLLRKILEGDPAIEHFNILAFNVGTSWVEPKGWLPNTAAGREDAFSRLDGIVLEGATDLSAALNKLIQPGFDIAKETPVNVFLLSDGQITWGEPDVAALVARFESRCPYATRFHCYRTGLGAENLELFEALTRKGGGIFNCFTGADLAAAARAHRAQCFQVERVSLVGGPATRDVLVAGRRAAVYPGGEMILAARVSGTGHTTAVLEGTFLGKKLVQEYPLEVKGSSEQAPRGWAEIAVASLLAMNDPALDPLVTAYCQQFGIGSRVASFLVLENDADYKRFKLEEERDKTVHGDLGQFLTRAWGDLGKVVSPRAAFERFLAQVEPRVKLLAGKDGGHVKKLLGLLADKDFELPEAAVGGALQRSADVPLAYVAGLANDRGDVATYLTEARRRADGGDVDAAVRVLSSVAEELPGHGDALRLVGYRLLDMKQPARAVQLFQRVQRQRPFEPHSYRDLARSLEECGKFGLAAVQYEIILAGTWHARFHDSLKLVAQEEYARMMQDAIRRQAVGKRLADRFGERLEHMTSPQPRSDLRVTISWNTDNTDVDLWVIEPDGTKCFFQNTRTPSGGELSQDQTQGYGPERYQIKKARRGTYTVAVHYFAANPNLLAGETHVNIVVARHAGSPKEVVERHTVILKSQGQEVEVCKVKF